MRSSTFSPFAMRLTEFTPRLCHSRCVVPAKNFLANTQLACPASPPTTFLTFYHHKKITYFNLHLVASGAPVPLYALRRLSKNRLEFGIMVLRLLAVSVQNLGSHLDFRKIGVRIPTTRENTITRPCEEAMLINGQCIMGIAMNDAIPLQHNADTAPKKPHARHALTSHPSEGGPGGRKSGTGTVSNSLGVLRQKTTISLFFAVPNSFLTPPKT